MPDSDMDAEAPARHVAGMPEGLGFFAIMFTDIVGSTDLRATLGDAAADVLHHEVETSTRLVVDQHHGSVLKNLGDGCLAVFRGPTESVHAAVALQAELARRNRRATVPLGLRVGIAAGEVNVSDGDVFGIPVNEAARLCAAAGAGGVLVGELAWTLAQRAEVTYGEPVTVAISPSSPRAVARPVVDPTRIQAVVPLPTSLDLVDGRGGFVGRAVELDRLVEQWAAAQEGATQLAVITGEPGIGKTRLLGELGRASSSGAGIVLHGRCEERTSAPYRPFTDALTRFVEHCPERHLATAFGPTAAEISRIVPSLAERLELEVAPRPSDPESDRWRIQDALVTTLRNLAAFEPVLLIIDDLHWASSTTIDLLSRLLEDGADRAVMVVLALRPWEPATDPDVGRLLADRVRLPLTAIDVGLDGLRADDVGELVARWTGERDLGQERAHELWEITAGNPLFVSQVLRSAEDGEIVPTRIPPGIADVVERQLERLQPASLEFLRAAALVGSTFEVRVSAGAAGLDPTDALAAFDEAVHAGFVHPKAGAPLRGEFAHALVKRTIEDGTAPGQRLHAHVRIVAAIDGTGMADNRDRTRRLAHHLAEAGEFGDPARGVRLSCEAAADAIADFALQDALALLDRADELAGLAPDAARACEVAVLRAEALGLGMLPGARDAQLSAAAQAEALGDGDRLARAALAHSRAYSSSFGTQDGKRIAALEAGLDLIGTDDPATRALLLTRLANELTFDDPGGRRFGLVDEGLALAREVDDPFTLSRVLYSRHYVIGGPEHLARRLREGEEMDELAHALDDRLLEMRILPMRRSVAAEMADFATVDRYLEREGELDDELGLLGGKWELACGRASRAFVAGDLHAASHQVKQAFGYGDATGQPDAFVYAGTQLAHLQYLRGNLASMVDAIVGSGSTNGSVVAWVSRQLHLSGRLDEARTWWERTVDVGLDAQMQIGFNAGPALTSWAYMATAFPDDRALIRHLRHRFLPYAGRIFNQLSPDQPGHHFLGLLAEADDDPTAADTHFAASIELLERIDAPLMVAMSQVAWGRALARRGELDRARRLATDAEQAGTSARADQIVHDAGEILEATR